MMKLNLSKLQTPDAKANYCPEISICFDMFANTYTSAIQWVIKTLSQEGQLLISNMTNMLAINATYHHNNHFIMIAGCKQGIPRLQLSFFAHRIIAQNVRTNCVSGES